MEVQKDHYIQINDSEVLVLLKGTFNKGCRETGPSYACGGEPGDPPSIEDLEILVDRPSLNGKVITTEDISWLIPDDVISDLEEVMLEYVMESRDEN